MEIDDDAIAETDWAKNIISAFQHDISRIGVVGGRVKPLWIVDRPLWLSDRLESYLSILNLGDALSDVHPGQYLVGCNIAYNKELLLSIGGFSTSLGRVGSGASLMSNEEIKVGEEIQKRGMRSIYQPKAIVQHVIDPARLSPAWFRRRAAWQAVSDLMLSPEKAEILRSQAQRHLLAAAQDDRRKKPLGFFSDDKSAEDLEEDIGLIYDLTIMNLSGGAV